MKDKKASTLNESDSSSAGSQAPQDKSKGSVPDDVPQPGAGSSSEDAANNDDDGLAGWVIAVICIAILLVVLLAVGAYVYLGQQAKLRQLLSQHGGNQDRTNDTNSTRDGLGNPMYAGLGATSRDGFANPAYIGSVYGQAGQSGAVDALVRHANPMYQGGNQDLVRHANPMYDDDQAGHASHLYTAGAYAVPDGKEESAYSGYVADASFNVAGNQDPAYAELDDVRDQTRGEGIVLNNTYDSTL